MKFLRRSPGIEFVASAQGVPRTSHLACQGENIIDSSQGLIHEISVNFDLITETEYHFTT